MVFAVCFIYLKYFLFKAKDFKPDNSKLKSVIDLRPSIIAKLQQLVKDGSNGLYVLTIGNIDPDVVASTLDVFNADLRVDSAAMKQLDLQKKLPDDIFRVHFDSLHIDGIGIDYLLHSKSIDITRVNIGKPSIEIYHRSRSYNQAERTHNDTISLYHRIKEQMNSIKVGHINISGGTLTMHDGPDQKNVTKLKEVNIHINDVLVDSSTQFDASRALFSKEMNIEAKDYMIATADSLYYFKAGALSISAGTHKISFHDVELNPRGNKEQFESKLKWRKDMFRLLFEKVEFDEVDWWAMLHREKFMAKDCIIKGGNFKVYLDRTLPSNPEIHVANFPHQLMMKLSIPVSVDHVVLKDLNLSYEEFNPLSKQSATAYFDKLNGQMNHLSNIPSHIKAYPMADFSGDGLFMHRIAMNAAFNFDLAKYKTGQFTADIHMGALDNHTLNSLAEPLGMFSIRSGEMQSGTAHIVGNNYKTTGKLAIAYSDLHIDPLKKADENGRMKKKRASAFIANVFLIKNSNPKKGEDLRQPEYSVLRDHHGNFFNVIWETTLTGVLKTIGIPVKLVIH